MKVSVEQSENSQAVLNIELDPEEMEAELEASYRRLVKRVNVPGFRRGKAPRSMLERYIGQDALRDDALKRLVPETCARAIEENGIKAFAQPQVELVQSDPVILKATVPTPPTVELGDYHHIRLIPEPIEVTPEQVDAVIEQFRHRNALWQPVERPVQFGDMVVINAYGSLEGKTILDEKAQSYIVRQDSPFPLPGFAQQLVGMEKGNQKEFTLSYPADYQVGELAGKEYLIQVVLSEIKEEKLPKLDDEFARSVDKEVDSVSALRERVLDNLTNLAEETANRRFEESVVKAVVDQAKVEFPPILVEQELGHLIAERARQFGGGDKGLASYLNSVGKSEEELREELHPTATQIISHSLVLSKVAEEEDIKVSAEEIDAEVENMVKNRDEGVEELHKLFSSSEGRRSIDQMLLTRKTVRRLVEIASEEGNGDEEPT